MTKWGGKYLPGFVFPASLILSQRLTSELFLNHLSKIIICRDKPSEWVIFFLIHFLAWSSSRSLASLILAATYGDPPRTKRTLNQIYKTQHLSHVLTIMPEDTGRKSVVFLPVVEQTGDDWRHLSSLSDHSLLLGCFYFPGVFFPSGFISHKWIGQHWLSTDMVSTEAQNRPADNPAQLKCCCTKGPVQFSNKAKNYSGRVRQNPQWNATL